MKKFIWSLLTINLMAALFIYYTVETPKPAIVLLNGDSGNIYLLPKETYFPTLRKKISEAQEEIRIASFLFKTDGLKTNWGRVIFDDLVEAKNRGVKVEVFLDRQDVSSSFHNPDLARINEQTMSLLKDAGIPVIMDSPTKTTHCKVVVIDRRFIFLGSHNLTKSAFKYNNELSLLIDSQNLAGEIIDYLERIQNEKPSQVTPLPAKKF